jgi:arabinose-5-phosphate isomerase
VSEKKPQDTSLAYAIEVLRHEAAAIEGLVGRSDEETFGASVRLMRNCTGRVVVTGIGKAWLVGQKISATLASTGTPSHAMHAAEALHGDLGRVVPGDVVLVLSNSGHTREPVELLGPLKKLGVPVIAMTGDPESPLGTNSDVVLNIGKLDEACPQGLAPTTTTTAMMALGDALALTVMKQRGFSSEDYAFYHPGGSLGRKLMKVDEVMRKGDRHALIGEDAPVLEALSRIGAARAGAITVVNADGKLVGIFTDGDLRRRLVKGMSLDEQVVKDLMTPDPKCVKVGMLATSAAHVLHELKIDELPVVDADNRPVGIVDIQDILGTV